MSVSRERHQVVFAIPGNIDTPSGGYGYDRRVIRELRAFGWSVEHIALPSAFPYPGPEDHAEVAARFSAIPDGSLVLVDGLAFGAMPQIAQAESRRLRLVALVHHPLALETGIAPQVAERLKDSETVALKASRGLIVTSQATARTLRQEFDVKDAAILVAAPGTDHVTSQQRDRPDVPADDPLILSVGSLTRRKDHATLISALQSIADRRWHCRIVGSDSMDRTTAQALRQQVAEAGLDARITLTGAVEDVALEFRRADIFALASQYEGYGMVFAEAMAWGLPIVGCRGGAVGEVVPETAGILVRPGDAEGVARALASLLDDPACRLRYARGSSLAGQTLPDWPATARAISDFLEAIA
nr:glycosyltransferase family 4 protein [Endobacterium cereale]